MDKSEASDRHIIAVGRTKVQIPKVIVDDRLILKVFVDDSHHFQVCRRRQIASVELSSTTYLSVLNRSQYFIPVVDDRQP